MPKAIDITGKKFFRLTAIKFIERRNRGDYYWLFRCDCGKEKVIRKNHVTSAITKSCGCFKEEDEKKRFVTHGKSNTRFYHVWENIIQRCTNPNASRYDKYGGRGIKCEWKSFEEFRDDMHESYLEHCELHGVRNTSINRIDNDGNYHKENCEWATRREQDRNKSTSKFYEFNGQKRTEKEWVGISGINKHAFRKRLKLGWSISKVLTQKVRSHK